jgi:hypothetical protein
MASVQQYSALKTALLPNNPLVLDSPAQVNCGAQRFKEQLG